MSSNFVSTHRPARHGEKIQAPVEAYRTEYTGKTGRIMQLHIAHAFSLAGHRSTLLAWFVPDAKAPASTQTLSCRGCPGHQLGRVAVKDMR